VQKKEITVLSEEVSNNNSSSDGGGGGDNKNVSINCFTIGWKLKKQSNNNHHCWRGRSVCSVIVQKDKMTGR
jgi:hypothetical protein